jgi:carboxymethylenebutenolidase
MGEIIEFPSNGGTGQGYLASPSGGGPGVIVIQEWWGLVHHIKDVCDRFAAAGFVALAPDLYRGVSTTEPDEAGKAMMALKLDEAVADMSGAVDALQERSEGSGVGVIGFCMGGGLALVLGCARPDAVKAVIACYGLIPWPDAQPDFSKLDAPVQLHLAEKDEYFTPAAGEELAEKLRALGKQAELFVHPGVDHAFFNDDRTEVYNETEATKVWNEGLEFFHANLG